MLKRAEEKEDTDIWFPEDSVHYVANKSTRMNQINYIKRTYVLSGNGYAKKKQKVVTHAIPVAGPIPDSVYAIQPEHYTTVDEVVETKVRVIFVSSNNHFR